MEPWSYEALLHHCGKPSCKHFSRVLQLSYCAFSYIHTTLLMKCTKLERTTVEMQFLASNKTTADLQKNSLSRSLFTVLSNEHFLTLSVLLWNTPAWLNSLQHLSYPCMSDAGNLAQCTTDCVMILIYFSSIHARNGWQCTRLVPLVEKEVIFLVSFFSFFFFWENGEEEGESIWMRNHLICHAGHHGVRFIRHKK